MSSVRATGGCPNRATPLQLRTKSVQKGWFKVQRARLVAGRAAFRGSCPASTSISGRVASLRNVTKEFRVFLPRIQIIDSSRLLLLAAPKVRKIRERGNNEAPADERAGYRKAEPNPPRHISTLHVGVVTHD